MSERFDYDGLLEVNDALRAENARLREAMQSAYDYITNHRHGKAKAMLFDGLELYRQAALQPGEANQVVLSRGRRLARPTRTEGVKAVSTTEHKEQV